MKKDLCNYLRSALQQRSLILMFMVLLSGGAFAQNINVSGMVKSATDGEPMIGVTIMIDGTSKGTVTDFDGNFQLKDVPTGTQLRFSYIGYTDLVRTAAASMTVEMQEDSKALDEVVVIGYGVQKKSNVTGAISSVKSEDLLNTPNSDAASALQGRVGGVQVVNNSAAPGAKPTIRVRGYSSNGSSDPLYIVDGLKVSDISYLDPNSIESMEVLKDAASAAIYGAEAGNGVILITTKNGAKGKTKVTLDASWTFSSLAKKVDLMNANEYKQFYTEGGGESFTTLYNQYNIAGVDTDWQDEVFETGKLQKYNVGVQGGNDMGTFFVTLGYVGNDGMVKYDKDIYQRVTGQINATCKIKPWLEVGTNNTITSSRTSAISESNVQYGTMKNVLLADPLTPVYYDLGREPQFIADGLALGLHPVQYSDGRYFGMPWTGGADNVLRGVYQANGRTDMLFVNGMTYANITPIKNLVFTTRLGYRLGNLTETEDRDYYMANYNSTNDTALLLSSTQYTTRYHQWENFANYLLETAAGDFSLMAGMSFSDYRQIRTGGQTNDISSHAANYHYLNYSTNGADDYVSGDVIRKRQIAYFGRLSWSFLDRYNAQFNFRADSYDAAYLDLDHNWGYFPSASIGWIFTNEEFMKNAVGSTFTYGKLRASYGVNGSISNLGNYMYAATLQTGQYDTATNTANMAYYLDGKLLQGTYPSNTLANPKLRWERSKQFDLGLDLRFFSSRLTATIDYYNKITDGLLIQSVAPLTTGTMRVYQNLGKVQNTGFEFELEWRDHIGDFSYGIKANLATVSNKVKEYKGEGTRISGSRLLGADSYFTYFEEGYPLWYLRGYQFEGVNASTGEAVYHDFNGDGQINEDDRTDLGSAIPDFTYGITLSAAYKGFDINIYGAGAQGNKLVYGMLDTNGSWSNRPMFTYEGRWTSAGSNATMPSALYQLNDKRFYNSDAFVFDASYFKIKQIQLGYTLPKKIAALAGLETVRAYVSLDNFFTFTDYPGSDPELNAAAASSTTAGYGGASSLALDYGGYPMSKSVSVGLNVAF